MKAAIIRTAGAKPALGEFPDPVATTGMEVIAVAASALSQFSRSRSSGAHYSSDAEFPVVAGADGVGTTDDGRRVYFVMPQAPHGALAERTLVRPKLTVPVPDDLDDVSAAAIANPGMSAWAALVERAALKPGETVLINGATGTAGRLAVQIAKHLGAGRVIATGRNEAELEELRVIGADVLVPFKLGLLHPSGEKQYEAPLKDAIAGGVNVVLDYLWGKSARTVMAAIVRSVEDATPVRFVHVGGASGEESIDLPGAALRSSSIQLMGSGLKSVPLEKLLSAIANVFAIRRSGNLQIATRTVPLSAVEEAWDAPGKPRLVVRF
ncbi:NADPH:quinone reductase [Granulicella rosea]|uniref:NADPH:quinone reductase n=1 Tax=Granulicella rosea TaxID=474952 RepID=A0A239K1F6_9BACT|nr:zinc-binding alcohol dehydrogenase family protein [Granulicella rosea]SNT11532.1 NADPH:quinone reductase [Granulicella rosea]